VRPSEGCLHELREHPTFISDGTSVENIGTCSIVEKSITMFEISKVPFIDKGDRRTYSLYLTSLRTDHKMLLLCGTETMDLRAY
jgi:hypothetical protein